MLTPFGRIFLQFCYFCFHLRRKINQVGIGLFDHGNQHAFLPIGIDLGIFDGFLDIYCLQYPSTGQSVCHHLLITMIVKFDPVYEPWHR